MLTTEKTGAFCLTLEEVKQAEDEGRRGSEATERRETLSAILEGAAMFC